MSKPDKQDKQKAALAELLGLEAPAMGEEAVQEARTQEAVLAYLESPKLFQLNKCKACEQKFRVNRANVAYCGSACRTAALRKMGFHQVVAMDNYEPKHAEDERWVNEKWWGNEPLVIPPNLIEQADEAIARLGLSQPESESLDEDIDPTEDIVNNVSNGSVGSSVDDILAMDFSNLY